MMATRRGRLSLAVLLLAGSMSVVFAAPATACDCAGQTIADHVAEASAVYVANPRTPDLLPGRNFRVERTLKGPSKANIRAPVNTSDGAACGTQGPTGPRLVTFKDARSPYELNLCMEFLEGNEAVEEAQAVLGEGRAAEPKTDWPFVLHWAVLGAAGVGVVGVFGFRFVSRYGD